MPTIVDCCSDPPSRISRPTTFVSPGKKSRAHASDTITTKEQALARAMAAKSQQAYVELSRLALALKPEARSATFEVTPAWRDSLYARFVRVGVAVDRAIFDAARPLVDRMIETRVASAAFGDSLAFRRTIPDDAQLVRALGLLKGVTTQRELVARASATPGAGEGTRHSD